MLCTWACVCMRYDYALGHCHFTVIFLYFPFCFSLFDLVWFYFISIWCDFFYSCTYAHVRHLIAKQSIDWHFSDNFSYDPCIIFAEDRPIKVMSLLRSPIWCHTNVTRYKFKISPLKRQITIEISLSSSSPSKSKKKKKKYRHHPSTIKWQMHWRIIQLCCEFDLFKWCREGNKKSTTTTPHITYKRNQRNAKKRN